MKLFTKEIFEKLPTIMETADQTAAEQTVIVKLFNPAGSGTWYIVAYDPEDDVAHGFANLGDPMMAEIGDIYMPELREFDGPLGLGIERDMYFESCSLQSVIDDVKKGVHV